jgi:bifunctional non-homologous end joining protein LigD
VIVPTAEGLSDFAALESDLSKSGGSDRLVYHVFDILHLGRLLDRKRVLQALLENVKRTIRFSEHLVADGPNVFRNACGRALEGVVSKRIDGRYESGRTHLWTKSTCRQRDTIHVVGWAQKTGKFDGLYLGRKERSKIVYAGRLERGFTEADKRHILEQLERLKTKKQPIEAPRKFPKAQWVKPKVIVDASTGRRPASACYGIRPSRTSGGI